MNTIAKYIGCGVLMTATGAASPAYAQLENNDSLVHVAFQTKPAEDVIGAVQQVNFEELLKKDFTESALDGSLTSIVGATNWGQSSLVLVDGMPRDPSDIRPSEIQSVSFLKGAAAVALYGSQGAKGVTLITTKRGLNQRMTVDFRATGGFNVPKSYPKFLDAASYMTLYNEACRNDGISERYDAATIYNTAAGTNPWRYPDQKYYNDDYLKKFSTWYGVTGQIRGGNERTHYYLNVGFNRSNGLIKVGKHKDDYSLRFNVRGNVDMSITNWLSAYTNASMVVNDAYNSRGDFWDMASSTWPNRFSVLLPVDMVDPNNASLQDMIKSATLIDGRYLLGGTSSNQTNAFADAFEAGYVKDKTRTYTFDVGLNFNLGSILEGLSFKTVFGIDYRSFYSEGFKEDYAVYEPTWANVNGKDMIVGLTKHGNDTNSTSEYVGQSTYYQNMLFRAQFDYNRVFADLHHVDAVLLGWGYQRSNSADSNHESSPYHKNTNVNAGLEVNYNYDQRYYATLTGVLVHSSKLAPGHRNAFSPAVTLGWRLGQEKFIRENAEWLDDLKIMASFANLHQDVDISDWYLWSGYNKYKGGWFTWRDGNSGGWTTAPMRVDNFDLTFLTRKEFRIGLDARLFNGLVNLNANWFTYDSKGGLTQGTNSLVPSFMNQYDASFLSWMNYNNDRRTGFDFALDLKKNFGEFDLGIGFSGLYLKDKAMKRDEMPAEKYLSTVGRPLGASFGYLCEGFFETQAEIDNRDVRQTFGGTLRPGDLKYTDVNGDGVVDANDRVFLGSWNPKFSFGINLTAKWRNFTLFAYGLGQTGGIGYKNNSYYNNGGDNKYSENAWLRWTPETASTALYPRLTTGSTNNNNQASTFWRYKTDRFTLGRVQLTYDFPSTMFTGKVVSGLSVYIQGDNLAVISKERKEIERSTGSPQARSYNLGAQITF